MSDENKKTILDFAMAELLKVLEDAKKGKIPKQSKKLKKIYNDLKNTNSAEDLEAKLNNIAQTIKEKK